MEKNRVTQFLLYDTKIPVMKGKFGFFKIIFIIDYLLIVSFLISSAIIDRVSNTRDRFLPQNDVSVTYPLEKDIVPVSTLIMICFLLPILIFGLFQIIYKSSHDAHHAIVGLLTSISLTMVTTGILKHCVGRYRPDYLALSNNGQGNEGRLSFPSGHASFSHASMVFLSLWLCGKFHIFSYPEGVGGLIRSFFSFWPLIISCFVAVSRVIDYHHNPSDIVAGSIIGSVIAFIAYFMYYPSLFSLKSQVPKGINLSNLNSFERMEDGEIYGVNQVV